MKRIYIAPETIKVEINIEQMIATSPVPDDLILHDDRDYDELIGGMKVREGESLFMEEW